MTPFIDIWVACILVVMELQLSFVFSQMAKIQKRLEKIEREKE